MKRAPRDHYRTGNPYEAAVGYSRAVRVNDTIAISGTTATEADGTVTGRGDIATQTRRIFEIIDAALATLGSSRADIIRLRAYVRDMTDFPAVVPVFRALIGPIGPAMTAIEISRFVNDDILIEIEADAIGGPPTPE